MRLVPQLWNSEVGREVVRELGLRPGERAADLGAGMGSAAALAARTGAWVAAIDPTNYMRWILRARSLGALRVLEGAAEAIPLPDSSVDALWAVNTMHHWTDRAAACREIARVLRPQGRLLLVDEDFTDPAHPDHRRHAERRARHGLAFEEIDPAALAATLREAGVSSAEGAKGAFARRPANVIRGKR